MSFKKPSVSLLSCSLLPRQALHIFKCNVNVAIDLFLQPKIVVDSRSGKRMIVFLVKKSGTLQGISNKGFN